MGWAARRKRKRPARWTAEALARYSDDEIVRLMATVVQDRSVLEIGDLRIDKERKGGAPPEAVEAVLAEAQRRQIPMPTLVSQIVSEAFSGQSSLSDIVAPSHWKHYEIMAARAVLGILKNTDVTLDAYTFDAQLIDRVTGQSRQIDLLLQTPKGSVACEFKCYPERILAIDKVEAFATKVKDVGAGRGLLVTPCGYHEPAIKKAKANGIVLYRLREVGAADVRRRLPTETQASDLDDAARYWLLEFIHEDRVWVFSGDPGFKPRKSA